MAKISLVVVFSLLVVLPFGSVLSQEESLFKDLIGSGSFSTFTEGDAAALFEDGDEEGSSLADFVDG
ncbi:hypothetical protein Lalb_Chr23g0266571 [Lupinus albus]|uniref:Uncharacterized protein n=1 Tax=Lupinus albus TaxID=3870 RepID=A0A6A4N642_LUPAL|nr:hypothetical protein Lalb_Chr23g0266571 [Lupinus albus]